MRPSEKINSFLIDVDVRDSLRKDGLSDQCSLKRWIPECCKLFTQHDTRLLQLLEIFDESGHAPKLARSTMTIIRHRQRSYSIRTFVLEEIRSSVESEMDILKEKVNSRWRKFN